MADTTQPLPPEVKMALGRIFMLMCRPTASGDVEQYEAARAVVLAHSPQSGLETWRPNYARDHARGAQGDA